MQKNRKENIDIPLLKTSCLGITDTSIETCTERNTNKRR